MEGNLVLSRLARAAGTRLSSAVILMGTPVQKPSILDMVVDGLTNGRLWILQGGPVWKGPGVLKPCIVCQLTIHNYEVQYDILGLGRSVSAHASCHQVWRAEADKLRLRTNPKLRQGKGEAS